MNSTDIAEICTTIVACTAIVAVLLAILFTSRCEMECQRIKATGKPAVEARP